MCSLDDLLDWMQLGSLKDSFPCFTRLNPCVAHCSTSSIPWVHHSRNEGSLDYDGGFVRLQIHIKFDMNIHHQQLARRSESPAAKRRQELVEKTSEDALRQGLEAQHTSVATQARMPAAIRRRLFRPKLRIPVATR
jgi:hypothetical protein